MKLLKRHKYGVAPKEERTVDGIVFHSKAEARRWGELSLLQRAGKIANLRRQPKWRIVINGIDCGSYAADFLYEENGKTVCEDVKGVRTQLYSLKKKIVEALYGVIITEVK